VTRAEYQAVEVVRAILGGRRPRYGQGAVPLVTYTDPGLATVGLTEADARRAHGAVRVLRFPFVENDLASAERLPEGVIKVVATNGGRILGVGIVGRGAAELIAPWALAMANRLPLAAMRHAPVSYPSRSEVSRRLAASAGIPRLTLPWRHRIIAAFRKRG
jgi:pyruvate/2-oxoglutarate dehydrogenase complex dihydrolipoamide dehydrogenase (E3) component